MSRLPRPLRRATAPPWSLFAVAVLAAMLLFGAGGQGRSLSGDPARYASVAREIVERGDPTRLTLDDAPYPYKPPLVFWLQAAAMSALGYTEFAARLPSRLFGLATVVLLTALLASRHGRRAALFGGLALATWFTFQRSASTARLDSALAFFTLAGIGAFLRADRRGPSLARSLAVGACFGLAILSKQAGVLGPLAVAIGALATGRARLLGRVAPPALLALVAVAAPWYVLQALREPGWLDRVRVDFLRAHPVEDGSAALRAYGLLLLHGAPWVAPAALGGVLAVRRWRRDRARALPEAILAALVLVLVAGIATRRAHYTRYFVPAVPAFAWLAGTWAAAALRAPWIRRGVAATVAAAAFVGWPLLAVTGAWPSRDKHHALERAVAIVRAERPGAPVIPAVLDPDSDTVRAIARFYFDVRLRPPDRAGADPPPFLLAFRLLGDPTIPGRTLVFRDGPFALHRVP